ncbi:butyrophilin-like protein 3 [Dromiciops gliroides]|uniref:butyrophilin-like protein 3 n=1 Tax=Dromiciops gliroides TaxID=33562 RepID=UPI001CC6DEEB|nr:butyrophilin-like protein 3 [Dromiciops gliroides]
MLNVQAFQCHSQIFHLFEHHLLFISVLSLIQLGSGQFQVFGPDEPIQALVGEDVIFSCYVLPKMTLEDMEVRFFRNQFSSMLLLYKDGREIPTRQMQEYQGRTQFVQDAITEGRVSLRLKNITPSDMATYGCWFSSQTFYQQYTWELQVAALGSTPLISLEGYRDGGILLVCQSAGWLPKPNVQWRQYPEQWLSSKHTVNQDDNGLFFIETTLPVKEHSNKNISCSVLNLLLRKEKESRVQIADEFFQTSPWMYAVLMVIILALAALAFIFYTYYNQEKIKKNMELKKETKEAEWIKATEHSVEITLDPDTAHPKLHVSKDQKSVTYEEMMEKLKTEKTFEFPCVLASQSFSSDKHYWEVEVGEMRKWYLGVCWEDVNRKEKEITFSPKNGYWILGLWNEYEYFIFNTLRKALSLSVQARRIGVFLNYEDKEISFFNVTQRSHIYTYPNCSFNGKALYPYFCPRRSDDEKHAIPMSISPVLIVPFGDGISQVKSCFSKNDVPSPQTTQCLLHGISCRPKRL